MNTLIRQGAAGAFWNGISQWGAGLIALVSLVVMARLLGPEALGLFALVMAPIALAYVFVEGPLGESLVQMREAEPGHVDAIFWAGFGAAICFVLVLTAARAPIADVLQAPQIAQLLPAAACLLLGAAAAGAPVALMQRRMQLKKLALIEGATSILGSVTGIIAALTGFGVWSFIAAEFARVFTRCLWVAAAAEWRPGFHARARHVKDIAAFNAFAIGARLMANAEDVIARIAVSAFLGQAALGYFTIATRLVERLNGLLVGPIGAVATPTAARGREDPQSVRALLNAGTRLTSIAAYPAFIGLALTAPILAPLAFGEAWSQSALVMQIVALVGLRSAVTAFNGGIIRAYGRADWHFWMVASGTAFVALLMPLAAPYGLAAAAFVLLARSLLTWPMSALAIKRLIAYPLRDQFTVGAEALAASLIMAAALMLFLPFSHLLALDAVRLALAILLGAIVYVIALALLAPKLARMGLELAQSVLTRDRPRARAALRGLA